jgi:hypothetical protein
VTGKVIKLKYGTKEISFKDEIGLSVQLDNNLDKQ